jgi:uncharacterized membrane protein YqjE
MFKNLVNTLINFIETKIEIYKLQFKEEAAKAFTAIILILLLSMVVLLFVLFISLFMVEIINDLLEHPYYGYLIVAVFYIIMGILTYSLRHLIRDKVTDAIFSEEEEN